MGPLSSWVPYEPLETIWTLWTLRVLAGLMDPLGAIRALWNPAESHGPDGPYVNLMDPMALWLYGPMDHMVFMAHLDLMVLWAICGPYRSYKPHMGYLRP